MLSTCLRVSLVFFLFNSLSIAVNVPANMDASQRRYAVVVDALVDQLAGTLTLQLHDSADNLPYEIRRRDLGEVDWGLALAMLPAGTSSWTDTSVSPGIIYEYQVRKIINGGETAYGYLKTGIEVDQSGSRGWVILLVDASMLTPLASEIALLESDLVGDGWRLTRIEAPRASGWTDPNPGQAPLLRQTIADL